MPSTRRSRRTTNEPDHEVALSDRQQPLLTKAEEIELGRRVQAGDKSAIDELVTRNLGLAVDYAMQRKSSSVVGLADLASEACFGLIEAAKRFDPDRGVRFSTYASHWIRCYLANVIQDNMGELRVPRHAQYLLSRLRKAEKSHGKLSVTSEATRLILKITKDQQRWLIHADAAFSASAMKINVMDGEKEDRDNTVDPSMSASERVEIEEENADLHAAIKRLSPTQRQVIRRRFFQHETLDTVGASLGLTCERVRQIQLQGIEKLRGMLKKYADADDDRLTATKTA
jgi:RNA polymerase sigma factor (sigma-70 family)